MSNHLSGEYFVAAELYRRGFTVGLTIGNAKKIDIIAERDGRHFAVQVKTVRKKHDWTVGKLYNDPRLLYILVRLNGLKAPSYFILTPQEIRDRLVPYAGRQNVKAASVETFLDRWDWLDSF